MYWSSLETKTAQKMNYRSVFLATSCLIARHLDEKSRDNRDCKQRIVYKSFSIVFE
jgi:hypothetical protein